MKRNTSPIARRGVVSGGAVRRGNPVFLRALEHGDQKFESDHPRTATLLNNLTGLYHARGKCAEVEQLHKRVPAIAKNSFRPGHLHVAASLENYAALLRKTGRDEEADRLENRAKAIRAKNAKANL